MKASAVAFTWRLTSGSALCSVNNPNNRRRSSCIVIAAALYLWTCIHCTFTVILAKWCCLQSLTSWCAEPIFWLKLLSHICAWADDAIWNPAAASEAINLPRSQRSQQLKTSYCLQAAQSVEYQRDSYSLLKQTQRAAAVNLNVFLLLRIPAVTCQKETNPGIWRSFSFSIVHLFAFNVHA